MFEDEKIEQPIKDEKSELEQMGEEADKIAEEVQEILDEESEKTPPIDEDVQPFLEEDTEDYEEEEEEDEDYEDEADYEDEEEEEETELPRAGPKTLEEAEEESQIARELLQKKKMEAPAEPEPSPLYQKPVIVQEVEQPPTPVEDPRRTKLQTLCEHTIQDPTARAACMVTIDEELSQNKDIQDILKVIAEKYADHINVAIPDEDVRAEPEGEEDYDEEEDERPIPFDEEDAHWRDEEFVRPSDFVAAKVPEVPKMPSPPAMPILPVAPPKKEAESTPTPPSEEPSGQ